MDANIVEIVVAFFLEDFFFRLSTIDIRFSNWWGLIDNFLFSLQWKLQFGKRYLELATFFTIVIAQSGIVLLCRTQHRFSDVWRRSLF